MRAAVLGRSFQTYVYYYTCREGVGRKGHGRRLRIFCANYVLTYIIMMTRGRHTLILYAEQFIHGLPICCHVRFPIFFAWLYIWSNSTSHLPWHRSCPTPANRHFNRRPIFYIYYITIILTSYDVLYKYNISYTCTFLRHETRSLITHR